MNKFLFLLLFISTNCFGSGYDLYINQPAGVKYYSFAPTEDGGFILCGTIATTLTTESTSFYFERYDSTGNLSWTKQFYDTLLYSAYGFDKCYAKEIVASNNGSFIFIGSSMGGYLEAECIVGKIDASGNLINSIDFFADVYAEGGEIKKTPDSAYVLEYHQYLGAGNGSSVLVKVDENLNELWRTEYGYGVNIRHGLSVALDNFIYSFADGSSFPPGSVYNFAPSAYRFESGGNISSTFICGYDPNGWFTQGFDYDIAHSITGTFNQGSLIAGGKSINGNENISLMYIDSLGDSLWTRYYGNNLKDIAYDIQMCPDSGYILTGTDGDPCASPFSKIFLMKLDKNEDSVWTKTFRGTINNTGEIVQPTFDGGFMIFGHSDSLLRIIKTDANGDIISPYSISNSQACAIYCTGDTATLSVNQSAAAAYHWSTGATLNSIQLTSSGLYSVIVTDGAGVNYPLFSPYLSYLSSPTTVFSSDTLHFCDSLRVSSSSSQIPGYTFQWFRNDTILPFETGTTLLINQSAEYKLIVSSLCGTDTALFTGLIHQRPAPPDINPYNSHPCVNDTTRYFTTATGFSYQWYSDFILIPGATNFEYYASITPGNYGLYSVVIMDSFGCTNQSVTNYILPSLQFNNLPVRNLSSEGCPGDTTDLYIQAQYNTYAWSNGDTTRFIKITQPGYYYAIMNAGSSCESYSDTLYVSYYPAVPLNLGTDSTTCVGNSITVIAGPSMSYTYLWQDSTFANFFNVNTTQTDTLQLYVQMTDSATHCKATDTLMVYVDNCLEVNEIVQNQFSLMPNPGHDYFKIVGNIQHSMEVKLTAIDGKLICKQTISNDATDVDISNLSPGIYFVILGNQWYSKLVKE